MRRPPDAMTTESDWEWRRVARSLAWLFLLALPLGNCTCSGHVFIGHAKERLSLATTVETANEHAEAAEGKLVAWAGRWDGVLTADSSGRAVYQCEHYAMAPEVVEFLRDAWTLKELVVPESSVTRTGEVFGVSLQYPGWEPSREWWAVDRADRIVIWSGELRSSGGGFPEWIIDIDEFRTIPVVPDADAAAPYQRWIERR